MQKKNFFVMDKYSVFVRTIKVLLMIISVTLIIYMFLFPTVAGRVLDKKLYL